MNRMMRYARDDPRYAERLSWKRIYTHEIARFKLFQRLGYSNQKTFEMHKEEARRLKYEVMNDLLGCCAWADLRYRGHWLLDQ
jgi:hypothetical protein